MGITAIHESTVYYYNIKHNGAVNAVYKEIYSKIQS